jgi:hypothetical protein
MICRISHGSTIYITTHPVQMTHSGSIQTPIPVFIEEYPHHQSSIRMIPISPRCMFNRLSQSFTPEMRRFLLITGILCCIWGILIIGLEIGTMVRSPRNYYSTIWIGIYLLALGLIFTIVAFRKVQLFVPLIPLHALVLLIAIVGLIFSSISYGNSAHAFTTYPVTHGCSIGIVRALKLIVLIIFILVTIHSTVNLILVYRLEQKSRGKNSSIKIISHVTEVPSPSQ